MTPIANLDHWIGLLEQTIRPLVRVDADDLPARFAHFAMEFPRPVPQQPAAAQLQSIRAQRAEEAGLFAYASAVLQIPAETAALAPGLDWTRPGRLAARDGSAIVRAVWNALARQASSGTIARPAEIEALLQSHDGKTFLAFGAQDQPESWWYDELVLLHAVTTYSVLCNDPDARQAALAGAGYCHQEIQPDHATTQPWALHAFVLNPQTHSLAEWILNASQIQSAGEPRGVALVLLADALYCLKHVAHPRSAEQV